MGATLTPAHVRVDTLEPTARLIPVHAQIPHVRTEAAALQLDVTRTLAPAHVDTQEPIVKHVFHLIF